MEKRTRELVISALRPAYIVLGFFAGIADKVLFGWLAVLRQRKENASLADDIQANLYFLYSAGERIKEPWTRVHPFDYASVRINYGNICFCFTLGQGQLNVSLSPRDAPRDTHELNVVIATLDSTDVREQNATTYLSEVGDLLRPRLKSLNEAFSENQYPEFRKKLSAEKETVRLLTRETEWELNKRLYR
jgi:hypothetical protein